MCLFQKTKELKGSTKYQKNFLTSRPKHKKKQQQQPHEAAYKKDVVEQQLFFENILSFLLTNAFYFVELFSLASGMKLR